MAKDSKGYVDKNTHFGQVNWSTSTLKGMKWASESDKEYFTKKVKKDSAKKSK